MKKEVEDLTRLHLNIYTEDYEWLKRNYGREDSVGMGKAVRTIIRNNVSRMKEVLARRAQPQKPLEDDEFSALSLEAANEMTESEQ